VLESTRVDRLFQIGDRVRVVRVPPHIENYPYAEVKEAFSAALGNVYRVDDIDWGGWVLLDLGEDNGGIGIQPDCIELVEQAKES
jgi:hypothetical protein